MAEIKITEYVELAATPDDADIIEIVDDVAGTPTSKKITVANLHNLLAPKATPTFTGQVTIPTINLTGGQIAFPATAVPSADPNTLDDYEEGTWTPDLQFGGAKVGIAYTWQYGYYTKTGNHIHEEASFLLSSKGSSVGSATIEGRPFALRAGNARYIGSAFGNCGTDAIAIKGYPPDTKVSIFNQNAGNAVAVTNTTFANNSEFEYSFDYTI